MCEWLQLMHHAPEDHSTLSVWLPMPHRHPEARQAPAQAEHDKHCHGRYCEPSATCSRDLQFIIFLSKSPTPHAVQGVPGQHLVQDRTLLCKLYNLAAGRSGSPDLRCGEREADARRTQRVEDAQLPAHGHDAVAREGIRAAEGPPIHSRLHDAARSAPH